jgi:hypothetical protein
MTTIFDGVAVLLLRPELLPNFEPTSFDITRFIAEHVDHILQYHRRHNPLRCTYNHPGGRQEIIYLDFLSTYIFERPGLTLLQTLILPENVATFTDIKNRARGQMAWTTHALIEMIYCNYAEEENLPPDRPLAVNGEDGVRMREMRVEPDPFVRPNVPFQELRRTANPNINDAVGFV